MTKEEFLEDCESSLVFDSDNIHVNIEDKAFCPFCGHQMKWNNHLYCDCENQKAFIEKQTDITNQIASLEGDLKNLKVTYLNKTVPFFINLFLDKTRDIRASLDQDEADVLSFKDL